MAAFVGLETPLTYISDENAVLALGLWTQAHPVRGSDDSDVGMDYFNRDWKKLKEYMHTARALDEVIIQKLTDEEVCDLEVLFYIGSNPEFGEHYEKMLAETVARHGASSSRWADVHHIMSKISLLDGVVRGSRAAGRPSPCGQVAIAAAGYRGGRRG